MKHASLPTSLGQACCRLALACSLQTRLWCSDSADGDDAFVPEPELLQRIGLHLLDQATKQKLGEITEMQGRVTEMLDKAMPDVEAAYKAIDSMGMGGMTELNQALCNRKSGWWTGAMMPLCEAICILHGIKPKMEMDP